MGMKTRIVTAVAVFISAGVHLKLWNDGFKDLHMVGPAFMLNAVAGLVIGVALVLWRSWLPPLLSVGFGLSTAGAFIISTTVGLYGVHEVWQGNYVWAAFISEIVAVIGGALVLWQELAASGGQSEHRAAARGADPV